MFCSLKGTTMRHAYGWQADRPDFDHFYGVPPLILQTLPTSVDMRSNCPPIYDQGNLGSCTANAIAGAIAYDQKKQQLSEFTPSRLFIYYNERLKEGTVNSDSGAAIRDGIKSVAKQGACAEAEWPYDINQFSVKPTQVCYDSALMHKVILYQRIVNNLLQMKGCLASESPFVYGFTVYESFESEEVAATGIVPMPQQGEQVLGGHAVMAVGYDDSKQFFICRNSWGESWGDNGYFYMPYAATQ
jgi:C1A family cysteine protease